MRTQFFESKNLMTYSKNLSLKLNENVMNSAQLKIYTKSMADEDPLEPWDIVNGVLDSLVASNSVEFKSQLRWAMEKSASLPLAYYRDFRLSNPNFQKVNAIIGYMKPLIPQYLQKGIQIGRPWDKERSLIINAILVLFQDFDVEKNKLSFIGIIDPVDNNADK